MPTLDDYKECKHCGGLLPLGTRKKSCESCRSKRFRAKRHRLSVEQLNEIGARQGPACAICETAFSPINMPVVDHDHKCCPGERSCGRCVRAFLCGRCNHGLGNFLDKPESCERAAAYLREHAARLAHITAPKVEARTMPLPRCGHPRSYACGCPGHPSAA